jgi:hypothetical protein
MTFPDEILYFMSKVHTYYIHMSKPRVGLGELPGARNRIINKRGVSRSR